MDAADIVSYEKVAVWNVTNGSRLETYAIEGQRGSGVICLNGAAARLVAPKDLVIIASFVNMDNEAAIKHEPKLIFVDELNGMLPTRKEEAGQAKLKVVH
jgi:aspartate 1-decarboxylase